MHETAEYVSGKMSVEYIIGPTYSHKILAQERRGNEDLYTRQ